MTPLLAIILAAASADPSALAALEDGLPDVAIRKLESLPAAARDTESMLLLARAYVEGGRPERAVELLKSRSGAGRDFWLAQAFAALGRTDESLSAYRAAKKDPRLAAAARLGEAAALRRLGRPAEALDAIAAQPEWPTAHLRCLAELERAEALLDLARPADARTVLDAIREDESSERADIARRDFLAARALAMSGDDAGAIRLFDALSPTDAHMAVAAVLGQAEALVRTGQSPTAETLLEKFISKNSDIPGLDRLFEILDKIYSGQPSPSNSELKRWSNDERASARRRLAGYYFAMMELRSGRQDRAEQLLERAAEGDDHSPGTRLAEIRLGEIRIRQGRNAEALAILPRIRASPEADFLRGLALAGLGRADEAVAAFDAAARDPALAESALFNAAVCELGTPRRDAAARLAKRFPQSRKLELLGLQEAYLLARAGDPKAGDRLDGLAASGGPAAAEAALALAEWKFERGDPDGARCELRRVSTMPGADPARADALAIFLADDGGPGDEALAAAKKFLGEHPGSAPEPEVRMKLGEILFRRGDFAGARLALESLAGKYPGSPQEIPALFLAAQSAARLQSESSAADAMLLYESVAASGHPLALRARLEQAVLQNILGKPAESLVILDRILASNPDPETRAAVIMEKGKTQLGMPDPGGTAAAIATWKSLAADKSLTPDWRNQAMVRIGAAQEKAGDPAAAVATYYDVMTSARSGPAEFFWFYKAGFGAARLLESAKSWEQAIRIYELIAAVKGPRAEEAKSRINKIRLENFLWEDSPES
jgi:tetratricopeptide (TPR) repeat protein